MWKLKEEKKVKDQSSQDEIEELYRVTGTRDISKIIDVLKHYSDVYVLISHRWYYRLFRWLCGVKIIHERYVKSIEYEEPVSSVG